MSSKDYIWGVIQTWFSESVFDFVIIHRKSSLQFSDLVFNETGKNESWVSLEFSV